MSTVPSTVDIKSNMNTDYVGSVSFTQPTGIFGAVRTASGFKLKIPANVSIGGRPSAENPGFLIEDMEITLAPVGDDREIAVCRCPVSLKSGDPTQNIDFVWDTTFAAMAVYESIRGHDEPQFGITLRTSIRRLITTGSPHLLAASFPAEAFSGYTTIKYSRDAWSASHRRIGFKDCVIAEIPYPSEPPHAWEAVWKALRDARNAFDKGGTTAWKDSAGSVRLALEEWRKIDKEKPGPGCQLPELKDVKQWTKEQRLDAIRWFTMNLANYAVHTGADNWTRDEALLLLNTLVALIAVRNP